MRLHLRPLLASGVNTESIITALILILWGLNRFSTKSKLFGICGVKRCHGNAINLHWLCSVTTEHSRKYAERLSEKSIISEEKFTSYHLFFSSHNTVIWSSNCLFSLVSLPRISSPPPLYIIFSLQNPHLFPGCCVKLCQHTLSIMVLMRNIFGLLRKSVSAFFDVLNNSTFFS